MAKPLFTTGNEYFLAIMERWRQETGSEFNDLDAAVEWALENGELKAPPYDPAKDFKRKFAMALRQQTKRDSHGNNVRVWQANKTFEIDPAEGIKKQKVLWFDIDKITHHQMELATLQRREQVIGDICQLTTDVDYFNENRLAEGEQPIEVPKDFTNDVAERKQPKTYGGDLGGDDDDDVRV
ncbi:MAG: hypothetical protein IT463_14640 [Planctomycetes bacterium]|nr:hypothetical protein [Planctomycetota bacterium]